MSEMAEEEREEGVIVQCLGALGFAFIEPDWTMPVLKGRGLFAHFNNFAEPTDAMEKLRVGMRVSFVLRKCAKGYEAKEIKLEDDNAS